MEFQVEKKQVPLHFGLDFMDEINRLSGMVTGGVNVGAGAVAEQQRLEMGDPTALVRVIYAASKGASPRPSQELVRKQIEQINDVDELQSLFDSVLEEIKNSFPLQFQLKKMKAMAEKANRKTGATNATK